MSVLFKQISVPTILVPKKGIEAATKIAKDFALFIDSATEGYNSTNGTSLTPAQGIIQMMDSGITFQRLIDENPDKVEFLKKAVNMKWSHERGFSSGYKFVNPRWAMWWTHKILTPYRPDLGKAIIEHPKGEEWIKEFVTGFRKMFWGK